MSNIYVSPTGNDSTGDGSTLSPYEHIHHAIDQISSDGDVIICKNGTYDEEIARTLSYDITIQSESGVYTDVIIKPLTLTNYNGFGTYLAIDPDTNSLIQNVSISFLESHFNYTAGVGNSLVFLTDSGLPVGTIIFNHCFVLGDADTASDFQYGIRGYTRVLDAELYKCTLRNFDTFARNVNLTMYDTAIEGSATVWQSGGSYTGDYNSFYNYTTLGLTANTNDIITDPKFTASGV